MEPNTNAVLSFVVIAGIIQKVIGLTSELHTEKNCSSLDIKVQNKAESNKNAAKLTFLLVPNEEIFIKN